MKKDFSNNAPKFIAIIMIVIVLFIVGGFFWYLSKNNDNQDILELLNINENELESIDKERIKELPITLKLMALEDPGNFYKCNYKDKRGSFYSYKDSPRAQEDGTIPWGNTYITFYFADGTQMGKRIMGDTPDIIHGTIPEYDFKTCTNMYLNI